MEHSQKVEAYFEQHCITDMLNNMINDMAQSLPDRPIDFMIDSLLKVGNQAGGTLLLSRLKSLQATLKAEASEIELTKKQMKDENVALKQRVNQLEQAAKTQSPAAEPSEGNVKVVIQRGDKASILVDNKDQWLTPKQGSKVMVMYISFAKGTLESQLPKVARTLLQLPLLTLGVWGDGSEPQSLAQLATQGHQPAVIVVPQAGLTSKIKDRRLQYSDQTSKDEAQHLYDTFITALKCEACALTNPPPVKSNSELGADFQAKLAAGGSNGAQDPGFSLARSRDPGLSLDES